MLVKVASLLIVTENQGRRPLGLLVQQEFFSIKPIPC